MRAVVYDAFGEPLRVRDIAEPDCPPDAAVVAVGATGVCRSDWHAWQGHDADVSLPHVPGHELAGTVERVGADVASWTPGARVTTPFVSACGSCAQCQAGESQVCVEQTQPGSTHHGSFAEQVVIRNADVNLVGLPQDMDFVTAASLGCRFATAYRAVTVHGEVGAGQVVAVHGCGGLGLSAVMVAVALGAQVVAVDPSPAARARALELGAAQALDPLTLAGPGAVGARVRELTDGGAHVALDGLGSESTLVAGLQSLRPRGRHLQVGLLVGDHAAPAVPLGGLVAAELSLHGCHGMSAADYPAMLARVASGMLRPDLLLGRVVGLDQAGPELAAMAGRPPAAGLTVVRIDPSPTPVPSPRES
ncbi:MAG: alcohol dehydrogenase [Nocardioidaceae bacterium]|jgi:alcohol dehydrogenase|nr:alcohol dehydrogenase [Nocardioidaceae bacterium]